MLFYTKKTWPGLPLLGADKLSWPRWRPWWTDRRCIGEKKWGGRETKHFSAPFQLSVHSNARPTGKTEFQFGNTSSSCSLSSNSWKPGRWRQRYRFPFAKVGADMCLRKKSGPFSTDTWLVQRAKALFFGLAKRPKSVTAWSTGWVEQTDKAFLGPKLGPRRKHSRSVCPCLIHL